MQSKIEIYQANATQCETRAEEMPPALRRDLLVLAENWRKLASKADEAEVKGGPKKQTNVNLIVAGTVDGVRGLAKASRGD
jgi:hypothetical protein